MFRHICIAKWIENVPAERVSQLLEWADSAFESAPFIAASHGRNVGGAPADWAYVIDFESGHEVDAWIDHPLHKQLASRLGAKGWAPEGIEPMFASMLCIDMEIREAVV